MGTTGGGLSMTRKADIGSSNRERAIAFINLDYAIDMSDHAGEQRKLQRASPAMRRSSGMRC
ncbi:MAG: hypothetical protein C5B58_11145 [Acidobacteria bacterium]|nr:MAG: hypothetical protein C5B58_11145 [Acidobacteriota bacterium]